MVTAEPSSNLPIADDKHYLYFTEMSLVQFKAWWDVSTWDAKSIIPMDIYYEIMGGPDPRREYEAPPRPGHIRHRGGDENACPPEFVAFLVCMLFGFVLSQPFLFLFDRVSFVGGIHDAATWLFSHLAWAAALLVRYGTLTVYLSVQAGSHSLVAWGILLLLWPLFCLIAGPLITVADYLYTTLPRPLLLLTGLLLPLALSHCFADYFLSTTLDPYRTYLHCAYGLPVVYAALDPFRPDQAEQIRRMRMRFEELERRELQRGSTGGESSGTGAVEGNGKLAAAGNEKVSCIEMRLMGTKP
ncbi:hypothetical protein JCM11251_000075 [Rhodosporidiobolus azoricus]